MTPSGRLGSGILTQFVRARRRSCKNQVFRASLNTPVHRHLLLRRTQRDHRQSKDAIGIGAHAAFVTTSAEQKRKGGCP
jgi:hypothetical protein